MALRAEQDHRPETSTAPGQFVPMPPLLVDSVASPVAESELQHYAELTAVALWRTKQSAGQIYKRARIRAADGYKRVSCKAQDLTRQTQNRLRHARKEHPVQLLAVFAGITFGAGIAIRIWRSRTS